MENTQQSQVEWKQGQSNENKDVEALMKGLVDALLREQKIDLIDEKGKN